MLSPRLEHPSLSRPHPAQAPPTLLTSGSVCVLRLPGIAMLFISVLLSLPCWAVSFLSPETMAYSLESPVPRMSQGRPRGCWLGPRLCSSCCAYGFTRGIFLPFILFWWERKVSFFFFFSVQFSSVAQSCLTLCNPMNRARQPSLSITNSQSSLKLMSIESVMPSSHLILCRPLLLLPPIPPSMRVFSNESTLCMRWQKIFPYLIKMCLTHK